MEKPKAIYSIEDIESMILTKIPNCPTCGGKLGGIEYYPHEGGILTVEFERKQWVYFTCTKCGYQWALWKLVQRIG